MSVSSIATWKMNMLLYRRKDPNVQILEYECNALAPPSTN
jgi:uncharacterized protein YuzB (UPF0349 family)